MAKKTVATLGKGGAKDITKVIKSVRSDKTGAYVFEEKILPNSEVKNFLNK
jgi:hypothetical protein